MMKRRIKLRFRTAVKLAKGNRYIQRMNGNTLFDLIKYQPENIDYEDVYADDWIIPDQSQLSYMNRGLRFGTQESTDNGPGQN
jgi:hypothetical protein